MSSIKSMPGRTLPTLADVASRAGVSTATTDRALNGRSGVRPATLSRVLRAASDLGYITDASERAASVLKPLRLVFLLPAESSSFVAMLSRMIAQAQEQFAAFNMRARVERIASFRPDLLAQELKRVGREADGIAFMALEHPAVREAVNMLAGAGVPTVTLISDIGNARRSAYVGLDNRSAGRTAGYLIARFIGPKPAKVAMIAGSLSYRAHEEREMGFLYLFEEMFPAIKVVGLREGHDDPDKNYRQTRMLLGQHPDLAGIYNIGGAADGVGRALKEMQRERDVVFIGHGLTPDTRALLIEGTMDAVITQNPLDAVTSCIAIFNNLRDGRDAMAGVEPPRSEIIFRENIPA